MEAAPTLDDLANRCRAAGLKATPQRIAVLSAVLGSDEHPAADEVHRAILSELPTISLGTVYKTLDALEEAGLIAQVALLSESRRYDANLAPHHHLICVVCKMVQDHTDPSLDDIKLPRVPGFRAERARVQIVGVCARCAEAPDEIDK